MASRERPLSTGRARRGRPAKISRAGVVQAGVEIAREQGLEAVGPMKVARKLAVTPMAIYGHVQDKDELLALVVEQILTNAGVPEIEWPADAGDAVRLFGHEARSLFIAHPLVLEAIRQRSLVVPSGAGAAGALMRRLCDAGLTDDQAVDVYVLLIALCIGSAEGAIRRQREAATRGISADTLIAQFGEQIAAESADPLPPPLVARLAGMNTDTRFASALELLVATVRGLLPH